MRSADAVVDRALASSLPCESPTLTGSPILAGLDLPATGRRRPGSSYRRGSNASRALPTRPSRLADPPPQSALTKWSAAQLRRHSSAAASLLHPGPGGVAPRSDIPDVLTRRALSPVGRNVLHGGPRCVAVITRRTTKGLRLSGTATGNLDVSRRGRTGTRAAARDGPSSGFMAGSRRDRSRTRRRVLPGSAVPAGIVFPGRNGAHPRLACNCYPAARLTCGPEALNPGDFPRLPQLDAVAFELVLRRPHRGGPTT
jgi:hypothetical protein